MLGRKKLAGLAGALAVLVVAGCTRSSGSGKGATPANPALRVVVPMDAPPYAFRQGSQVAGLEVDFARELATALNRPLDLHQAEFVDVIPALRSGQADVAMAGLTITQARSVQIAFSDPYLRSGLLALVRREDAKKYSTPKRVLDSAGGVGVVNGTTAERFVRERIPLASILVYPTARAAADELRTRRIDFVVHDAPVAIWFVSNDEANLSGVMKLLNEENLGWGVRRDDEELRTAINGVLARWRTDGTRDRVLARWLPYWERLESEQRPK